MLAIAIRHRLLILSHFFRLRRTEHETIAFGVDVLRRSLGVYGYRVFQFRVRTQSFGLGLTKNWVQEN